MHSRDLFGTPFPGNQGVAGSVAERDGRGALSHVCHGEPAMPRGLSWCHGEPTMPHDTDAHPPAGRLYPPRRDCATAGVDVRVGAKGVGSTGAAGFKGAMESLE